MSDVKSSALESFSAELRAHRAHSEWTQVELGDKIGYSGSYISDVERGARSPALDFATACDREFGLPGTFKRWHELTRGEAYPPWFGPFVEYEQTCSRMHNWDTRCFTGLLQTEDYARAIVRAGHPEWTDQRVSLEVQGRLDRQQVLERDEPPSCWFVIGEATFRTVFGGNDVMHAQMDHVLEIASHPRITVQVWPFTIPDCPGADGPVTVFDFDGKPALGYAEGYEAGRVVESSREMATLVTMVDHLRAGALSPRDSVTWIATFGSNYAES